MILRHFIDYPKTKITFGEQSSDTLYAIQKEVIRNRMAGCKHFKQEQQEEFIQALYEVVKPQSNTSSTHPWRYQLLDLIAKQQNRVLVLGFLGLIKKHNITPKTLQSIFCLAQKKGS